MSHSKLQSIGFLVSDLELGLHRRMLAILQEACVQRGFRLLVFEGRALETPVFQSRCYNTVYRMISTHRVDALVVASSEIGIHVGPDGLSRFLSELPLPTVVIGMPVKGISSFSGDDTAAVHLLLDHLSKHGRKRIVWVSGPVSDPHALVRLFAFRDRIRQIHPDFDDQEDILHGNDTAKGGFEAMSRLHARISTPGHSGENAQHAVRQIDAVCFSNDEMAIGAMDYCGRNGIRIPEDIVMTGIDDIALSALVTPGLTTVTHNLRGMIGAALDRLEIQIEEQEEDEKPAPIRSVFSPSLQVRGTCGCESHEPPMRNAFLDTIVQAGPDIGESIQTFDTEELFNQLESFLKDRGVQTSFLLAYEDLPLETSCRTFEAPVFSRMLHGFLNGRRLYDNEPFQTAQLLPDEIWDQLGQEPLLMKPLFFLNEVFGYLIASAEESQRSGINDLRLLVSQTIKGEKLIQEREQAQKRVEWALDAMRTVNTRLSDISLRDELTGLYNRRGFIQEAQRHLHGNPAPFLLVFADMNGLKHINDTYGHDDGDLALKTVADILRHSFRDHDILARMGGDEFAALVKDVGPELVDRLESRFGDRLRTASDALYKPYRLSFARGYVLGNASNDFETLMAEADQKMYAHKALQKQEEMDIIRQ